MHMLSYTILLLFCLPKQSFLFMKREGSSPYLQKLACHDKSNPVQILISSLCFTSVELVGLLW
jgi:hypothetical protein